MEVNLDFLKMRLDKTSELINDIETAIDRIEGKFENTSISINHEGLFIFTPCILQLST